MIPAPYEPPPVRSRSSSRLPWVLGGGAVLAALLCFGGAAAVLFSFSTGAEQADLPAAIASPAPEAQGSAAPVPADVGTWPELAVLPATAEPSLRSATTGAATQVAFVNQGAAPVTVSWLNESGTRVLYQTLGPGQTYVQQTYVGHPWVVSGPDGRSVAVFQPVATPARAVLR